MVFLFLGFPSDWKPIFAVATGLIIVVVSYRLEDISDRRRKERHMPYVEHKGDDVERSGDDITNSNLPLS